MLLILNGCGGGGDTQNAPIPSANSAPKADTNDSLGSQKLVASESFNFRVDKDVTIILTSKPQTKGVIKLYHGTDFYDEQDGVYYPDGKTLLASWIPSQAMEIDISFNNNWEGLLIEWLPQSGLEKEQYIFFPASQIGQEITISL